jgi:hypothetical protein
MYLPCQYSMLLDSHLIKIQHVLTLPVQHASGQSSQKVTAWTVRTYPASVAYGQSSQKSIVPVFTNLARVACFWTVIIWFARFTDREYCHHILPVHINLVKFETLAKILVISFLSPLVSSQHNCLAYIVKFQENSVFKISQSVSGDCSYVYGLNFCKSDDSKL